MDSTPYNVIKLNVDATWPKGKVFMVILGHDFKGEVVDLGYDNLECMSTLATKFLTFQKIVANNILGKEVQIKSNYKAALEALLGIYIVHGKLYQFFRLLKVCFALLRKLICFSALMTTIRVLMNLQNG